MKSESEVRAMIERMKHKRYTLYEYKEGYLKALEEVLEDEKTKKAKTANRG